MSDNNIFNTFSETLIPQIKEIIKNGKESVHFENLLLIETEVKSGFYSEENIPCNDRFKISIPYAGQSLIWEILFNHLSPEQPPDFIFDDKDFLPEIEDIPSLVNWDLRNSQNLYRVVNELIKLYKKHQLSLISKNSRVYFEYSSLYENGTVKEDDIEIVSIKKAKNCQINLMIQLQIDFSNIPPYLTKDNPGEDRAALFISYKSPECDRPTSKLYLSPRIGNAVGDINKLRIPSIHPHDCLMDFVSQIAKLLQTKVTSIVETFAKKKEYVAAFLSYYGRSVLEYDTIEMSMISFLFEWQEFFFIIIITLSPKFPAEQPTFTFQSIYHDRDGKPFTQVKSNYPYSPRWSGIQMAERARSFILEYISEFQQISLKT